MDLTRPGFSVYLTLGWPSPGGFAELVHMLSSCVDFFEFGLPSRRPLYDGSTIRRTHEKVTRGGLSGLDALKLVDRIAGDMDAPFIVMAYLGDFNGGLEGLLEEASSSGAASVLMPDLAFEYYDLVDEYVDLSRYHGLRPAFFASSKFPHGILSRFASYKPLLIYLGLQPATGVELPVGVLENVATARRLIGSEYLLAGFAISEPRTARRIVDAGADAVVVGSALVRVYEASGAEEAARLMYGIGDAVRGAGRGGG